MTSNSDLKSCKFEGANNWDGKTQDRGKATDLFRKVLICGRLLDIQVEMSSKALVYACRAQEMESRLEMDVTAYRLNLSS